MKTLLGFTTLLASADARRCRLSLRLACTVVLALCAATAQAQLQQQTGWKPATEYPVLVAEQSCVTSGGYIYCVGGRTVHGSRPFHSFGFSDAYYAPLTDEGVGEWRETTPFALGHHPLEPGEPIGIRDTSCVASNGYIYCFSGRRGTPLDEDDFSGPSSAVYYAPLSAAGIGAWQLAGTRSPRVWGLSCAADDSVVICVGGGAEQTVGLYPYEYTVVVPSNVVWTAPLLPGGGVGPGTLSAGYPPGGIMNHQCVANNGVVYCIAGRQGRATGDLLDPFFSEPTSQVWTAPFSANGAGPWTRAQDYVGGTVEYHKCTVVQEHAVCVGGGANDVWSAQLMPDGTGPWSRLGAYPAFSRWDGGSCVAGGDRATCVGGHYAGDLWDVSTTSLVYSMRFSVTHVVSDRASCTVAVDGAWDDTRSACIVPKNLTLDASTTLTVGVGTTLIVPSGSTLNNKGTLLCQGICEVAGGMLLNSGGQIDVTGTLQNTFGTVINHAGSLHLTGTLGNRGSFFNGATIGNAGLIANEGGFTNTGTVANSGGKGRWSNAAGGTVNNSGLINATVAEFENRGSVTTVLNAITCQRDALISPESPLVVPGTWSAGTCTAGFLNGFGQPLSLARGFTLQIPAAVTLIQQGHFDVSGTVINQGNFINEGMLVDGAYRSGTGLVRVRGVVKNEAGARLTNRTGASLTLLDDGRLSNGGHVEVLSNSAIGIGPSSSLENSATLFVAASGVVTGYGALTNAGTITNQGTITTGGTLGFINNIAGGRIVNELAGRTNGRNGTVTGFVGITTAVLDAASCASLSGAWTSRRCVVSAGAPTIAAGTVLKVGEFSTLELRVPVRVDGGLVVRGALTNHDLLSVDAGILRIDVGGSLLNFGEIRTTQTGSAMDNAGTLTIATGASIRHASNTFSNGGRVFNYGSFLNLGQVHNAGEIINTCGGALTRGRTAALTGNPAIAGACETPSPLEPVNVGLVSTPASSAVGQAVTLTATLSETNAAGSVSFYSGAVLLGASPVTAGKATLLTPAMGAGVNHLTAKYSGDALHAPAASASRAHAVSATGSRPASVAISDFNRDGDNDLAVVNEGSNTVTIMIGAGTGAFITAASYGVGQNPIGIAAADLNGDGTTDLAVANYMSHSVSVLLGAGDGTFASATEVSAGDGAVAIAVADIDRDGHADLAVANNLSNVVTILRGSGTGTFHAAGTVTVGDGPAVLAAGDFNEDQRVDLVVGNDISRSLSVLFGRADGGFESAVTMPNFSRPSEIVIADIDRDGHQDVIVANLTGYMSGASVQVLAGAGNGTFGPARNYSTDGEANGLAIGDFNGDGAADLAVSNPSNDTVSVLHGTGGLGHEAFRPGGRISVGRGPRFVAAGDLNGDGISDFVTANTAGDDLTVHLSANLAPDLTVSQTPASEARSGARHVEHTVSVHNAGRGPTTSPVRVALTMPAGIEVTAIYGDGWNCDLLTLACGRGDSLPAGAAAPVITARTRITAPAGTVLPITALASGGGQFNLDNDLDTAHVTILPRLELTVFVDSAIRYRGVSNAVLTGTVVGLANGDAIEVRYATAATARSPVGVYVITASLTAAPGVLDQYNVTVVNGELIVTARPNASPTAAAAAGGK